jgi:hypothetical protein
LYAPLLTTFEVFVQQLASYLGASSASSIRQFNPISTIVPSSSELFIEHVENRTVLTMQFDERWRRASLNSTLGIESVIDYETHLASMTTSLPTTPTTRKTTPKPRHSITQQLSTSFATQSTDSLTTLPTNNNDTSSIVIGVVIAILVLGVAVVGLLVFVIRRNRRSASSSSTTNNVDDSKNSNAMVVVNSDNVVEQRAKQYSPNTGAYEVGNFG